MIGKPDAIDYKTMQMSRIGVKKQKEHPFMPDYIENADEDNTKLLHKCREYWESMDDFRERRKRARNYYRGKQLEDVIDDPDNIGSTITESEYIKNQGKIPFKQNIIRQLVKNVIGQYRLNPAKSQVLSYTRDDAMTSEMLTNAIQAASILNDGKERDARNFEEFLLSGGAVGKVYYGFIPTRDTEDVRFRNVNPTRIFFNTDIEDVTGDDINLIGEIIDTTLDTIITTFAKTAEDEQKIREHYATRTMASDVISTEGLTSDRIDDMDFLNPPFGTYRLFEVWEKKMEKRIYAHDFADGSYQIVDYTTEELDAINQQRIMMAAQQGINSEEVPLIEYDERNDQFWYVKYLTPTGHVLYEGETPYEHKEHPYVLKLYPLLDGETWGLVEDIIDQQRYINRLITLYDFIIGSSSKGVLLVPEEAIPDDMSIDDIADEWTKFRGVVKIKMKPGIPLPKQISANATNIGINELLQMQVKFLQEISGVSGAIQGHAAKSNTPSSLYAQEAQNSATNIRDIMESFASWKSKRDWKVLKVIRQYYREPRYLAVSGSDYKEQAKLYNPNAVRDMDFTVTVAQGNDTAVYRQIMDDILFRMTEQGLISVKSMLQNSSMPFADKLLSDILREEQAMAEQQAQMSEGMGAVMQQAGEQTEKNSNPKANGVINQLMSN